MNWVVGVFIGVFVFSAFVGAGLALAAGRWPKLKRKPKPIPPPEPEPETLEQAAKRVEKELAAEWDDEFRRLNRAYRPAPEPAQEEDPYDGRGELIEEHNFRGDVVMRFWIPPAEPYPKLPYQHPDEPEGSGRSRG